MSTLTKSQGISHQPSKDPTSNKDSTNMYEFDALNFNVENLGTRHANMIDELSLFAPYSHEDECKKSTDEDPEIVANVPELNRPVTPINNEIKTGAKTYNKLAKYVRRRIEPRAEYSYLPLEEQQGLAAVVMGEVNSIWSDLRKQLDDPFLNAEENDELQRRMCVHIVTVCEQLFLHYLTKAELLTKRGVFSGPANMSRLNTQLALDTSKYLNVLTMRRYIVSDIRGKLDDIDAEVPGLKAEIKASKIVTKTGEEILSSNALSHRALIEVSRPKSKVEERTLTTAEHIEQMRQNMPPLDTTKLIPILEQMPQHRQTFTPSVEEQGEYSYWSSTAGDGIQAKTKVYRKTSEDFSREKVLLKRCDTVPLLDTGDTLLQEMGVEDSGRDSAASLREEILVKSDENQQKQLEKKPDILPGTLEYIEDDLRKLTQQRETVSTVMKEQEDELPPLIQALTRSSKADARQEAVKAKLLELEEKERKRLADAHVELEEATHSQPATVSTKLPNNMTVRTSDIRVSQRVCMSKITLQKHTPLYNDLLDELDAVTVKQLDSNLFLGDEITEVYKEIMKTVPTDHLDMEIDDIIEPTAAEVNLSNVMASASLSRKQSERVINPNLHHQSNPPWGLQDIKEWAQTPVSPPKDFKGRALIAPRTPRGNLDPVQDLLKTPDIREGFMPTVPQGTEAGTMQDVLARSYASWLFWWKNTLNGDDYNKYLSTQETDYMALIFHFYNSDDESDADSDIGDPRFKTRTKKTVGKKPVEDEKELKLQQLKDQKSEYKPGEWNPRSVLMGGLGKDPEIEVVKTAESSARLTAPTSEELKRSPKSKTKVMRRSSTRAHAKIGEEQDTITDRITATRTSNKSVMFTPDTTVKSAGPPMATAPAILTPQDRLEQVWTSVMMPDNQKLDMAIKYSSDAHHEQLVPAIEAWEYGKELVLEREALVADLETFERQASDPNRFFEKGYRGSAMARINEARARANIYKKIDEVDVKLNHIISVLKQEFTDTLTYQGRPYVDKMKWDRTEMLYWLQEERKQQALDYEANLTPRMEGYNKPMSIIKPAHLEPITPQS